jgi:hypothetical protein
MRDILHNNDTPGAQPQSPSIGDRTVFKSHRLIALGALVGALAAAWPVAGASAAQSAGTVQSVTTPGSSIPCYPFPAFCDPSTGQPAAWAPTWVWLALGQTPPSPFPVIPLPQPITFPLAPTTG